MKKATHERSKKYRQFCELSRCVVCNLPGLSTAHHHGPKGLGETLGDLECVPLCRSDPETGHLGCHDKYHFPSPENPGGKLTPGQLSAIESSKLLVLQSYVRKHHADDIAEAPLDDREALKIWLMESHPEDFEESSVTRKRKGHRWPKRKVPAGRGLKGRGFAKLAGLKLKIGERRPGSAASRKPKKGMA